MAFSEETGDRIAWTKIEQMQSNKYKVLAFYVSPNELLTPCFHDINEFQIFKNCLFNQSEQAFHVYLLLWVFFRQKNRIGEKVGEY